MAKYVYPALFTVEEGGGYSIQFPDIYNCFTDGNDIVEAMANAEDVLCMMLYDIEKKGADIPFVSSIDDIQQHAEANQFVNLIACDTLEYRKYHESRAVKKTLSIPSWLNEMAEDAGINFSGVLQDALKKQLEIF